MKIFKQLFSFISFINIILVFMFILENINNLNSIDFNINVNGTTYDFTFNLYSALLIIGAIFILAILASVSIFGLGLNDTGTKLIGKYLSLTIIIALMSVASAYYFLQIGAIGLLFQIFFIVIYVLYAITGINNPEDTDV